MTRTRYAQVPRLVLPVVADGALSSANSVGGRLVPVAMVDMTGHPQVEELVRIHQHLGAGDCASQWGQPIGQEQLLLRLTFTRPVELILALAFDLPQQAGLVDQMLTARALYLQHGVEGNRMSTTQNYPRLLIELPPTGFEERWEKIFPAVLMGEFRRSGMSRGEAKRAAKEMVARWREFGSLRMP